MDRDSEHAVRSTTDARWLMPGLSMVMLLALLAPAPGAWVAGCAEVSGRISCGHAVAVPVIVVEAAQEEPALWRSRVGVDRAVSGDGVRTVGAALREALLSLPPPVFV